MGGGIFPIGWGVLQPMPNIKDHLYCLVHKNLNHRKKKKNKKKNRRKRPRERFSVKNDEPKRQEIGLDRAAICWTRFPRLVSQWLKAR